MDIFERLVERLKEKRFRAGAINFDRPEMKVRVDEQGRPVGVEGEEELVPADTVIIAINQGPKDKLVNTTHGLEATERGLLKVDENNMTTREGVFAAGDVVHGSLTVVHAVEDAKNAAAGMMRYMENG